MVSTTHIMNVKSYGRKMDHFVNMSLDTNVVIWFPVTEFGLNCQTKC